MWESSEGLKIPGLSQGPSLDCATPEFSPRVVLGLQETRLLFDWNDTVKDICGLLLNFPFGKVSRQCPCKENLHIENHLMFCF